jgi:hypothetical protein
MTDKQLNENELLRRVVHQLVLAHAFLDIDDVKSANLLLGLAVADLDRISAQRETETGYAPPMD